MKRTVNVWVMLATAALTLPALAQDKAPAKDAPKPAPAAPAAKPADKPAAAPAKPGDKPAAAPAGGMPDMAMMGPGPEHAKLKAFEGKWNFAVKSWMDPTKPEPTLDNAVAVYAWVLDGRYLTLDVTGVMGGMPFHGMGVWGYNRMDKRYESGWIDNFGTGVGKATGQADATGKVFTMTAEETDSMTGKPIKVRQVITLTGADTFKEEFFSTPAGGKETKSMEINATRVK